MEALEQVAKEVLPPEMGYDWADLSYQEKKASGAAITGFVLSLIFVFLILAALYESWTLPLSVLLSTPVAVFGAFFMLWLRRFLLRSFVPAYMIQIENDVYSPIAILIPLRPAPKKPIPLVPLSH